MHANQCRNCSLKPQWKVTKISTLYEKYGEHFDLNTILPTIHVSAITQWNDNHKNGYVHTKTIEDKLDEIDKSRREQVHINYTVNKYMEIKHYTATSVLRILNERLIDLFTVVYVFSGTTTFFNAVCSRGDDRAIQLCAHVYLANTNWYVGVNTIPLLLTVLSRCRSPETLGIIIDIALTSQTKREVHRNSVLFAWILNKHYHNPESVQHLFRHNLFVFHANNFIFHDLMLLTLNIECMLPLWHKYQWFKLVEQFDKNYHIQLINNPRIPRRAKNTLYAHITCKVLEWNIDIDATTLLERGIISNLFGHAKSRYYAVRRIIRWYRRTRTTPKHISTRSNKRRRIKMPL